MRTQWQGGRLQARKRALARTPLLALWWRFQPSNHEKINVVWVLSLYFVINKGVPPELASGALARPYFYGDFGGRLRETFIWWLSFRFQACMHTPASFAYGLGCLFTLSSHKPTQLTGHTHSSREDLSPTQAKPERGFTCPFSDFLRREFNGLLGWRRGLWVFQIINLQEKHNAQTLMHWW